MADRQQTSQRQSSRSELSDTQQALAGERSGQTSERTHELLHIERRAYAEPLPEQRAQMAIPTQRLLELPEGAQYAVRSGRASVEAQRQGDTIVVRGRCDSVARRSAYFERRAERQSTLIDSLRERLFRMEARHTRADSLFAAETAVLRSAQQTHRQPCRWYRWLLAGFLAGGAAAAWLTKTNPLKTIVSRIKKFVA